MKFSQRLGVRVLLPLVLSAVALAIHDGRGRRVHRTEEVEPGRVGPAVDRQEFRAMPPGVYVLEARCRGLDGRALARVAKPLMVVR
jgi:hypothetical protein